MAITVLRPQTAPSLPGLLELIEVKKHLRIDCGDDDGVIERLTNAAIEWVESETGALMKLQSWMFKLDGFPVDGEPIVLPRGPIAAVPTIAYIDTAGASQTWASTNYACNLAHLPAMVWLKSGKYYPATANQRQAVTITADLGFSSGSGDENYIPDSMIQAVHMLVAHWYENRGEVSPGVINPESTDIPAGVRALVAHNWCGTYY